MEKSLNVYQRVLEIMSELDYIQKGSQKVNNQYRFVSHDQVTAAIHPLLVKHRVLVIPSILHNEQDGQRTMVKIRVQFVNVDEPADRFEVECCGHGIDSGDKGVGKAYSYAYKYALLKTFALETGDDPDNDAKSVHKPSTKKEAPKLADNVLIERYIPSVTPLLSDDDKAWAERYLIAYTQYHQKDMAQSIVDYSDRAKFVKDMGTWRAKQEKVAKAA